MPRTTHNDLPAQLDEILRNLASLRQAGGGPAQLQSGARNRAQGLPAGCVCGRTRQRPICARTCPRRWQFLILGADICRRELVVGNRCRALRHHGLITPAAAAAAATVAHDRSCPASLRGSAGTSSKRPAAGTPDRHCRARAGQDGRGGQGSARPTAACDAMHPTDALRRRFGHPRAGTRPHHAHPGSRAGARVRSDSEARLPAISTMSHVPAAQEHCDPPPRSPRHPAAASADRTRTRGPRRDPPPARR